MKREFSTSAPKSITITGRTQKELLHKLAKKHDAAYRAGFKAGVELISLFLPHKVDEIVGRK